jgi:hypothetical protein
MIVRNLQLEVPAMYDSRMNSLAVRAVVSALALWATFDIAAFAHCDSTHGPVILEARAALEAGDVTPVLKWVTQENEPELKAAFLKAQTVRGQSSEAMELADQYFIETLVRLHRAGEGAPYTGIKDEPVEPIVAMADEALDRGSAEPMIDEIGAAMSTAVRQKFQRVLEARRTRDESVEAGREYVEAYVTYVHFVEGIHDAVAATAVHHED